MPQFPHLKYRMTMVFTSLKNVLGANEITKVKWHSTLHIVNVSYYYYYQVGKNNIFVLVSFFKYGQLLISNE